MSAIESILSRLGGVYRGDLVLEHTFANPSDVETTQEITIKENLPFGARFVANIVNATSQAITVKFYNTETVGEVVTPVLLTTLTVPAGATLSQPIQCLCSDGTSALVGITAAADTTDENAYVFLRTL